MVAPTREPRPKTTAPARTTSAADADRNLSAHGGRLRALRPRRPTCPVFPPSRPWPWISVGSAAASYDGPPPVPRDGAVESGRSGDSSAPDQSPLGSHGSAPQAGQRRIAAPAPGTYAERAGHAGVARVNGDQTQAWDEPVWSPPATLRPQSRPGIGAAKALRWPWCPSHRQRLLGRDERRGRSPPSVTRPTMGSPDRRAEHHVGRPGHGPATATATATSNARGSWILDGAGQPLPVRGSRLLGGQAGRFGGRLRPAAAIFASSDGGGYWVVTALGRVSSFGDAPAHGDMSGTQLNGPIVAASGS